MDAQDKLYKLLALAGGTSGPESDTAMRMAQAIAQRYGLSLTPRQTAEVARLHRMDVGRAHWLAHLGWAIADYANVSVLRSGSSLLVFGGGSDFGLFDSLFTRARREIESEAERVCSGKSEHDAFKKGGALGFCYRLQAWRASSSSEQPETGLVLVGRSSSAEAAMRQYCSAPGKLRTSAVDGDAYRRGVKFGSGLGVHAAEVAGGES